MEIARLDNLAQVYFGQALAHTTRRTYQSAHRRYLDFCSGINVRPLPITQSTLCLFVTKLASQGVSYKSIKGYLSALRYLQIATDGSEPGINGMSTLGYILLGIKRVQATTGACAPRPRLPITAAIMRVLKHSWEAHGASFKHQMLWAACCTCFHGFLRSGEATVPTQAAYDPAIHLSIADVSVDAASEPRTVIVHIKASKTDQFRQGVNVFLGRTDNELCPVAAMLAYIAVRGVEAGPLFRYEDKTPLTREALVREVRSALQQGGIDPTPYSGHSFRSGAASTAAAAGVQDSLIKILGRWQSSAYQLYVRLPRESLAAISSRLANQ